MTREEFIEFYDFLRVNLFKLTGARQWEYTAIAYCNLESTSKTLTINEIEFGLKPLHEAKKEIIRLIVDTNHKVWNEVLCKQAI